jgi:hypothetical protein
MDNLTPLATVALAGLIHASFQLSISTLTLLGSRAIGAKVHRVRLLKLVGGFSFGAIIMTLLLLSLTALLTQMAFEGNVPSIAWATACGFLLGLCVAVWIFYYRREPGTSLWVPRGLARYLVDRTKATRVTAEALSLGMTSVLAELLFIAGPLIVSALLLIELAPQWQLIGIATYGIVSLLPFMFVALLISNGYNIGKIQRWRSSNKGFLQFIAGCGLIVLAFCVYVNQVSSGAAIPGGGLQ